MDGSVHPVTPERRLEEPYLAALRDLCLATEEAIACLAASSPEGLWQAIARQESLAARLQEMISSSSLVRLALGSPPHAGGADTLPREIFSLHRKLAILNRRYAALLGRLKRSVELSLAVCRSCGGFERSSPAPAYRTWSCEV
jgi:hypothetical protein